MLSITKMTNCVLPAALVALCTLNAGAAEWLQAAGPYGGAVVSVAAGEHEALASTGRVVFRSVDRGETWKRSDTGLPPNAEIEFVAKDEIAWFAAARYEGFFRSVDGGHTWVPANGSLVNINYIHDLQTHNGHVYAILQFASSDLYYYVWSSALNDWEALNMPEFTFEMYAEGQLMLAAASYGMVLHRSIDGGQTWHEVSLNRFTIVEDMIGHDGAIFAATFDGIDVSYDDGQTWQPAGNVPQEWFVALESQGTCLLAAERTGLIYRTYDRGQTWELVGAGLPPGSAFMVNELAATGPTVLLASHEGMFRSADQGANWSAAETGIINVGVREVIQVGDRLAAVGNYTNLIYWSNDQGRSWTADNGNLPAHLSLTTLFAWDEQTLFVGAFGDGVYRSLDGGQTWSPVNNGIERYRGSSGDPYHEPVNFTRIGDDLYFASGGGTAYIAFQQYTTSGGGVYRSSNLGASWTPLRSGIPVQAINGFNQPIWATGYRLDAIGDMLFLCLRKYGVFRSTDRGASWQEINNGLPVDANGNRIFVRKFLPAGDEVLIFDNSSASGQQASVVYVTANDGNSWSVAGSGLDHSRPVTAVVKDGERVVLAQRAPYLGQVPTFFESTDAGRNWYPLVENVDSLSPIDLVKAGETLVAGTASDGVWRLAAGAVGDLNCDGEVDFGDINAFVLALTDPVGYAQAYPACELGNADINGNGKVDFEDINPFIDLLTAP